MRRLWTFAIMGVVIPVFGYLLYRQLERYSLEEVVASLASIPVSSLLLAGACAGGSYLCLTGFDALAVRYAGHRLAYRKIALASFVALSIGHNIGIAALSSGAIRYRFYTRFGMSAGGVGRVIIFCGVTVAIGLVTLAGVALLVDPPLAAAILGLGDPTWVVPLGSALLALVALYAGLAAFVRRPLAIRHWALAVPSLPLALGQIVVGTLNFVFVAACLYFVIAALSEVSYTAVATAYVLGNAAGIASHVPGGLGVLEGVVLFLLPAGQIIGALVAFRVLYFLIPLGIGGSLLALSELLHLHRRRARSSGDGHA